VVPHGGTLRGRLEDLSYFFSCVYYAAKTKFRQMKPKEFGQLNIFNRNKKAEFWFLFLPKLGQGY